MTDVVPPALLNKIREEVRTATFLDGKSTATGHTKTLKRNQQIDASQHQQLINDIAQTLLANDVFQRLTFPEKLASLMISRYRTGEGYGIHCDDPMMNGVRTDLSFTLFLDDPTTYEGGELEINLGSSQARYKLPAGSILIYPTHFLHQVLPVSKGTRHVVVGWLQSYVKDPAQREILWDLDNAIRSQIEQTGGNAITDTLTKTYLNLQRMWLD